MSFPYPYPFIHFPFGPVLRKEIDQGGKLSTDHNELKPSKWAVDFQTDLVITARTPDQDIEISLVQLGRPTGEFLKLPLGIRLS